MMRPVDSRAATNLVGIILLVGVTVIVATTVVTFAFGFLDGVQTTPQAAITVEEKIVSEPDVNECPDLNGELALDTTLTAVQRADEVYVIVSDEGGERKKTIFSDPAESDVGTSLVLVNDNDYDDPHVDIGETGGSDIALCPGETATFRFYASYEDETYLIQKYTVD
jgi:hypothetical protein